MEAIVLAVLVGIVIGVLVRGGRSRGGVGYNPTPEEFPRTPPPPPPPPPAREDEGLIIEIRGPGGYRAGGRDR